MPLTPPSPPPPHSGPLPQLPPAKRTERVRLRAGRGDRPVRRQLGRAVPELDHRQAGKRGWVAGCCYLSVGIYWGGGVSLGLGWVWVGVWCFFWMGGIPLEGRDCYGQGAMVTHEGGCFVLGESHDEKGSGLDSYHGKLSKP